MAQNDLKIFSGTVILTGDHRQQRVMMATACPRKFQLVTGLSADLISTRTPQADRETDRIATGNPDSLFRYNGDSQESPGRWEVVPEKQYSYKWRYEQERQANAITQHEYQYLQALLADDHTVAVKTEKLAALVLVEPDGRSLTDKGRLLAQFGPDRKSDINVREGIRLAESERNRQTAALEVERQKKIKQARNAVVEAARAYFRQRISLQDLELAVAELERIDVLGSK